MRSFRSFNALRKTVIRGLSRDTAKLEVKEIQISAPLPPLPEIVVTPTHESLEWGPDDASPSCVFPFFIRDSDYFSEVIIVPRETGPAFRARPLGLRPARRSPARFLTSVRSTKRHAVGNFAQVVSKTTADRAGSIARYQEALRLELWQDVQAPLPSNDQFSVVVPGSSTRTDFKFGRGMYFEDMHRALVAYLTDETRRKSPVPMVLLSKTYPEAIYDAKSYNAWLVWMKKRDAKDRVLMAV